MRAGTLGATLSPHPRLPLKRLEANLTKDASLPKAEWQVAEAKALVHTLDNWSVVETVVVPTKTPDKKLIFSKGVLEHLTGASGAHVPVLSSSGEEQEKHRLSSDAASWELGLDVEKARHPHWNSNKAWGGGSLGCKPAVALSPPS